MWHAGDRHEWLAEEHHLPALHQEQQADPVVLAGGSGQGSWQGYYSSPPKETRPDETSSSWTLVVLSLPHLWHAPHLPQPEKEIRNPALGWIELLQLGCGQCIWKACWWSTEVNSQCWYSAGSTQEGRHALIGPVGSFQPGGMGKRALGSRELEWAHCPVMNGFALYAWVWVVCSCGIANTKRIYINVFGEVKFTYCKIHHVKHFKVYNSMAFTVAFNIIEILYLFNIIEIL